MTDSKKSSGKKSVAPEKKKSAQGSAKPDVTPPAPQDKKADKPGSAPSSSAPASDAKKDSTASKKAETSPASTTSSSSGSSTSTDKKPDSRAADKKAEPVIEAVPATAAVKEYKPSKAPIVVAVIALLLALGAVIAAVLIWMWSTERVHQSELAATQLAQQSSDVGKRGERNEGRIDGFEKTVVNVRSSVQGMELAIKSNGDDVNRFKAEVDAARAELKAGNAELAELVSGSTAQSEAARERVLVLEKNLKQLRAHIGDSRGQWMVAEVEYLLIVARQRLHLLGDTGVALRALQEADTRLEQLADPAYLPVRRALHQEIKALQNYQPPKIAKAAFTLSSLANNAHTYKANGEATLADLSKREIKPEGADEPAPVKEVEEPSWIDAIGDELSDLYTVRHYDTKGYEPPLTADRAYFLKQNLQIKLDAAKLALLRDDPDMYKDTLEQAGQWVATNFNSEDPAVKQLRIDLQQLQSTSIKAELPSISGSYDVLKRVQASIATQREEEEAP